MKLRGGNGKRGGPGECSLSIVVTCKGRLAHLKQSLPKFAAQPYTQTIVVDVACPDRTGDWVANTFPDVQVVRLDEQAHFNIARARNAGLAAAQTTWVAFLDADMLVKPGWIEYYRKQMVAGSFLQFEPVGHSRITGACIVETAQIRAIEGYDEVFEGYGEEDPDLYDRLELNGVRCQVVASAGFEGLIHHDAELRTVFHANPFHVSLAINTIYRSLKRRMARIAPNAKLTLPLRQQMRAAAERLFHQATNAPDRTAEFQMSLPEDPGIVYRHGRMEQRLAVRITLPPRQSGE